MEPNRTISTSDEYLGIDSSEKALINKFLQSLEKALDCAIASQFCPCTLAKSSKVWSILNSIICKPKDIKNWIPVIHWIFKEKKYLHKGRYKELVILIATADCDFSD